MGRSTSNPATTTMAKQAFLIKRHNIGHGTRDQHETTLLHLFRPRPCEVRANQTHLHAAGGQTVRDRQPPSCADTPYCDHRSLSVRANHRFEMLIRHAATLLLPLLTTAAHWNGRRRASMSARSLTVANESAFAPPTPTPSLAAGSGCADQDATVMASFGFDCSTAAAMGYCDAYLCPACVYSGYCDPSCEYCPTPAPTISCVDDDATVVAMFGADCSTAATMGYCDAYLCPTCVYSRLCDSSCEYCSTTGAVPSASPSRVPTIVPTSLPTISAAPTTSHAPTLVGNYDVDSYKELKDNIALAEDGRQWVLTLAGDIVGSGEKIDISSNKDIKIIGSYSLGRRARVTQNSTIVHKFLRASSGHVRLWLENLDVSGWWGGNENKMIDIFDNSVMMVRNCRFAENNVKLILKLTAFNFDKDNFIDWGRAELTLERCLFADNEASFALHVAANQAKVVVNGSRFVGHRTADSSDPNHFLIEGYNSTVLVYGSDFVGNTASALRVDGPDATVVVQRSSFLGNHNLLGAGINLGENIREKRDNAETVLEVSDSLFERNTAAAGAAIYVWASAGSQITLRNCTLRDNHAQQLNGGAVVASGNTLVPKTVSIVSSVFENNTAENNAGAVSAGSNIQLYVLNSTFANNMAREGAGGAAASGADTNITVVSSKFERNKARHGAGGALFTVKNKVVELIAVNFTENEAATDGGAVRCEAATSLYPRGATRFLKNLAQGGHGGGISLDDSSLKTNEGAVAFEANKARLGGALAGENGAAINISTGCRTLTFEMHWADSTTLEHAEDSNSIVIRRVRNANNSAVVAGDMIDERGKSTNLSPSGSSDTEVSFCLAPGKYEMIGSEGKYCFEGWGGGYVRAVDLEGSELLAAFTVQPSDLCHAKATFNVEEDSTYHGAVLFADNSASSGGAVYVGPYCTADLSHVDTLRNSAVDDGGAFFVDYLGDLSLARLTMDDNTAFRNGGAMSAGSLARISIDQTTAKRNAAGQSGGMLHLSDVLEAALRGIDAADNKAATSGGAIAVFEYDSIRSVVTLVNSSIHHNEAGEADGGRGKGGGIFLENSELRATGVQLSGNSVEHGDGGGIATRGAATTLALSDVECVKVDILLDWTAAGHGCTDTYLGYNCETFAALAVGTCREVVARWSKLGCSGCPCNLECVLLIVCLSYRWLVRSPVDSLYAVYPRFRDFGILEKYFVISSGNESIGDWDTSSDDFNGIAMRGLPLAGTIQKFSFCAVPGEYVLHAIDMESDAWWACEFSSLVQGTLEIGDTVTGDTSEACSRTGVSQSNDHFYRVSLEEDTNKTCNGNSVMLSSCGSDLYMVRLILLPVRTGQKRKLTIICTCNR